MWMESRGRIGNTWGYVGDGFRYVGVTGRAGRHVCRILCGAAPGNRIVANRVERRNLVNSHGIETIHCEDRRASFETRRQVIQSGPMSRVS